MENGIDIKKYYFFMIKFVVTMADWLETGVTEYSKTGKVVAILFKNTITFLLLWAFGKMGFKHYILCTLLAKPSFWTVFWRQDKSENEEKRRI